MRSSTRFPVRRQPAIVESPVRTPSEVPRPASEELQRAAAAFNRAARLCWRCYCSYWPLDATADLNHNAGRMIPTFRGNAPCAADAVDLLLLNASNLPDKAVYPYAFVQVSALARYHGLKVARFDFVRLNRQQIHYHLDNLIRRHRPRMIGLHLRQPDSVVESEYLPPPLGDPSKYFLPVEDTRALVGEIRRLTQVPIVAGGFGFSAHPRQTAARLQVDFGVQGEPDGFFARFADVLARRDLHQVPNLIYRQGRTFHANPRVFYPPFDGPEYTDEMVDELVRFYGERSLLEGTMTAVPVEIARGCPFRCYFCNEPAVKGRRVRYRNWSVVEADLATLVSHGIRNVWFVCSEINIHPRRARTIARRMRALNAGRDENTRIGWRSYSIPRMAPADLRAMLSAGFQPGWNDFPSFDDTNLARCRVPFRARAALDYYRRYLDWADKQREPPADRQTFYLFLGNAFATARTIITTLRRVDALGLQARHEQAAVGAATRVFCVGGKYTCGDERSLSTLGRRGRIPLDIVGPTYFFTPALVRQLGSELDLPVERPPTQAKLAWFSHRKHLPGRTAGPHAHRPAGPKRRSGSG